MGCGCKKAKKVVSKVYGDSAKKLSDIMKKITGVKDGNDRL